MSQMAQSCGANSTLALTQPTPIAPPVYPAQWNELAENLGRLGFPMAQRFAVVRPTMYGHLDAEQGPLETVFDLLEVDERPRGAS